MQYLLLGHSRRAAHEQPLRAQRYPARPRAITRTSRLGASLFDASNINWYLPRLLGLDPFLARLVLCPGASLFYKYIGTCPNDSFMDSTTRRRRIIAYPVRRFAAGYGKSRASFCHPYANICAKQ
jgi:hypothetical protein